MAKHWCQSTDEFGKVVMKMTQQAVMKCSNVSPFQNWVISLKMVITCNFQWLLRLSCNRAIQFNSITNRVDASNLWCDYLDFWSQIFFGVFSCFEKSHSWLDGLHFQTVYCHYRPDQRGNFNRSWKIQLPFQAPWTQNWHFGTLKSKLKQIGKIQNIYFCEKLREIWLAVGDE